MKRGWYKLGTWLMWLVLPITALHYWRAWDQLPARMAVHFDAHGQPNGYTSREGSLVLGLGIMVVMLVLFTVAALTVRAVKPSASWPVLAVSYVVLGLLLVRQPFHHQFQFECTGRPFRAGESGFCGN